MQKIISIKVSWVVSEGMVMYIKSKHIIPLLKNAAKFDLFCISFDLGVSLYQVMHKYVGS